MSTNNIDYEIKKINLLKVAFYRGDINNPIDEIKNYELLSFHFEEGISHPYTGILKILTKDKLSIETINIDYLIVKVEYSLISMEVQSSNSDNKRVIWALVKDINDISKRQSTYKNEIIYKYSLSLESPLSRIENSISIFTKKNIYEILSDLLSDDKNLIKNPLLNNVIFKNDVKNLETLNKLDEYKINIQRGQEDTLSFFNRILIGYGINYIFKFNPNNGVDIIFSRNNLFNSESKLKNDYIAVDNNTYNKYRTEDQNKLILIDNNIIKQEYVNYNKIYNKACELKNNWISFEDYEEQISNLKKEYINFIYKNLCLKSFASSHTVTLESNQDINLETGSVLQLDLHNLNSKSLVSNIKIDIQNKISKQPVITIKANALLLNMHNIFSDGAKKILGEFYNNYSKYELGSFANESLIKNNYSNIFNDIDILEAVSCDKNGDIKCTNIASYVENSGNNTDLFYGQLVKNNELIQIHSLINGECKHVNKIMQGQRILVLRKNGSYYLYGFIALSKVFDIDPLDELRQDIYKFTNKASISFNNFSSNNEYIYYLITTDSDAVDNCVLSQAIELNKPKLYDETYVKEFKDKVAKKSDLYNKYVENLQQYTANLRKEENFKLESNLLTDNNKIKDLKNCLNQLSSLRTELLKLAHDIVDKCEINFIHNPKENNEKKDETSLLSISSKDGINLQANSGKITIEAKDILLNASDTLTLKGGDLLFNSPTLIKSYVGGSSIELKHSGTKIFTGSTFVGSSSNKDNRDASNMYSSSLSIGGYYGISASAFTVKVNANHSLSINGPLKSGISLGYGTVKISGTEIKFTTHGRIEQYRNISQFAITTILDILESQCNAKNTDGAKTINNLVDTGFFIYDTKNEVSKKIDSIQKAKEKKEQGADFGKFDYVQAVVECIIYTLDTIYSILKKIDNLSFGILGKSIQPWGNKTSLKSWLDQIGLYISYLKVLNSITVATARVLRASSTSVLPSVSSISLDSNNLEFKTDKINLQESTEIQLCGAPASAPAECNVRALLNGVHCSGA